MPRLLLLWLITVSSLFPATIDCRLNINPSFDDALIIFRKPIWNCCIATIALNVVKKQISDDWHLKM